MVKPILHGPAYSTYVRTARLALTEKGVDYDLDHFDFMEGSRTNKPRDTPLTECPLSRMAILYSMKQSRSVAMSMKRSTGPRCSRPPREGVPE
jgi:hypothetical protein